MKFRNIRKNVKAISPVISVLLMIAVAVVASLVAYAWVMGYMNFQTGKAGQSIQIQSMAYVGAEPGTMSDPIQVFDVYVQNVGDSTVQFAPVTPEGVTGVYVNDVLAYSVGLTVSDDPEESVTAIEQTDTGVFSIYVKELDTGVQDITFKITAESGTFAQATKQFDLVAPEPLPP